MDRYRYLNIEELTWDEFFREWVLRPTKENQEIWQRWLTENPDKADIVASARELVEAIYPVTASMPLSEKQEAIRQIMAASGIQEKQVPAIRSSLLHRTAWLRVAAVLVLITGIGWAVWTVPEWNRTAPHRLVSTPDIQLLEKRNTSGETLLAELEDGSSIRIGPNSVIRYPSRFKEGRREVYLEGEAFFDIAPNPSRPFLVYAGETVTKVLGTSFHINARENSPDVIVAVRSGKVSVFAKNEFERNESDLQGTGLILTPNQQAVFSKDHAQLTKTLVDVPVVLPTSRKPFSFAFDNTPLKEVFAVLEEAYGVNIVCSPDLLVNRSLTVSLEDESLYEKLNVVCKTIKVSYYVSDGRIFIKRKDQTE